MKILFVCRRNHGRSQLAEALFEKFAKGKHQVSSVGTEVIREGANREGEKISDQQIIAAMKELGIDISEKVRNQLTPQMVEEADYIIVTAQPESIPDYLKQSPKAIFWEIKDTGEIPYDEVKIIRDQLKTLIKKFIQTLDEKKIKPWKVS